MVNKLLAISLSIFAAPVAALTGLRSGLDDSVLVPDGSSTLVEVSRVGASSVDTSSVAAEIHAQSESSSSQKAAEPTKQEDGFLSKSEADPTKQDQPVLNRWWSPNSMTGQLCRFLLAAGFLFAEMMLIFLILAGIEYTLCWWKPHIFRRTIRLPGSSQGLDGTTTTRPDNPADRLGSYLVTPNLHEHVNQHNSKRIRLLEAEQQAAKDGKPISKSSLAPATAA